MNGMDPRFEIRESPGMGWGLFARAEISQGDFIVEYTGTKLSAEQADESKSKYLFEIDDKVTLDGEDQSNHGRWLNHSCVPNVEAFEDEQKILLYAMRDIFPGEELTIDYGQEYFEEFIKPHGCKCGAEKHRT
jgi:SET domain-containing protein